MRFAALTFAAALLSGCGGKALQGGGLDAAAGAASAPAAPEVDAANGADDAAVTVDVALSPPPDPMDAIAAEVIVVADVAPAPDQAPPKPTTCLTCIPKQSCAGTGIGLSMCGPLEESCCTSITVPGGAFYRSFDGVNCPSGEPDGDLSSAGCYTHATAPATVSAFQLDKFEVTVARFRRFMSAVVAGWTPPAGAGAHIHLHAGKGVEDVQQPGTFESGWDPAWNVDLYGEQSDWDRFYTTSSVSIEMPLHREDMPIGAVAWTQAYAFCIWDGGFLPTEAEWNFAAAGGKEQRAYPWSKPPTSTTIDCAHAASQAPDCQPGGDVVPVGATSPLGDGLWGHTELAGNRGEWTLDWMAPYAGPCVDCARLQPAPEEELLSSATRVYRGLYNDEASMLTSFRGGETPQGTFDSLIGLRCARPLP